MRPKIRRGSMDRSLRRASLPHSILFSFFIERIEGRWSVWFQNVSRSFSKLLDSEQVLAGFGFGLVLAREKVKK